MSPLRWTVKSPRTLARKLTQAGHWVSTATVAGLPREEDLSLLPHTPSPPNVRQGRWLDGQLRKTAPDPSRCEAGLSAQYPADMHGHGRRELAVQRASTWSAEDFLVAVGIAVGVPLNLGAGAGCVTSSMTM